MNLYFTCPLQPVDVHFGLVVHRTIETTVISVENIVTNEELPGFN